MGAAALVLFAHRKDSASVFVFPEAAERTDLHPFVVDGDNVDMEDRTILKTEV